MHNNVCCLFLGKIWSKGGLNSVKQWCQIIRIEYFINTHAPFEPLL